MKKLQSEYPDLDKYQYSSGDIFYYKKNTKIKHNPYGPAVISSDGYLAYFIDDEYHRLDGPARIYANGDVEYWINYSYIGDSKQEFYNNIKNLKTKNINNQNKIDILNIKNYLSHGLDIDSINILKSLL